ncbi:PfkB family carbohydrate kinase [Mucisphaera calidilacus]|uniref:Putative sugar kinase YdjH n=1 Tax=Mucisphaera calidilacus TaxID=2527982 RepID=A0A518BV67_9BACT|nr:PfkB family carbohydrate kinase [Mucisphaera calidilacus]QDU70875.1 putative sugar kinase YdjH [Mucisphaera calidilacus]
MSLIVTGAVCIDTITTPSSTAENLLGGSGIYFPAAASFFTQPRVLAAVGDDFPDDFLATFDHFNIDRRGLEIRKGSKTFRWHGKYHENMNGRDTVGIELNVLLEEPPALPDFYADSKVVFLAVDRPSNQLNLLNAVPDSTLTVMDTIDLYINQNRDELLEVIRKVDGLIINDSEAHALTGHRNPIVAAAELEKLGPAFIIIKKGEHGVVMKHRDGWAALPAYPADKVVDPTGAGDSFAGAMMGYLTETGDTSLIGLRKALAYGTVTASFNIEDFSLNRMKTLTRDNIDKRLAHFTQIVSI